MISLLTLDINSTKKKKKKKALKRRQRNSEEIRADTLSFTKQLLPEFRHRVFTFFRLTWGRVIMEQKKKKKALQLPPSSWWEYSPVLKTLKREKWAFYNESDSSSVGWVDGRSENISLTSGYETRPRLNSDQKTLQNNQKTALIIIIIII